MARLPEQEAGLSEGIYLKRDLFGGPLDCVEALTHEDVAVHHVGRVQLVQPQVVGDAVEGVHALVALVAPVPHLAVHPVGRGQVEHHELVYVFLPDIFNRQLHEEADQFRLGYAE
ncbi:hypothetical protein HMPREF2826_03945 [Olsenella sp. HMSC062G07]|nr:hypothetical protein HMPREF2826_03945 [Olsenella sp. HMSC062G07]